MSDGRTRMIRPALYVVPDEPDQVLRLARFREEHPDVIIATGEFGTWQARIPQPIGEIVTTRYTLRNLLDRLDQLTGQHQGQPDSEPG